MLPRLLLMCALLSAPVAQAASFPYLYHGVVVGEGHQPDAVVIRKALAQVLERLTGITVADKNQQLLALLDLSTQLVSEYELLPPDEAGQPRFRIGFHRDILQRHLKHAGLSVWDVNHPNLLLFVVQADGAHPVRILDSGGKGKEQVELRAAVESLRYQKGLLLMFPINDYRERALVMEQVLPGHYRYAARYLRQRYGADGVVLIVLEKIGADSWHAECLFLGAVDGRLPLGEQLQAAEVIRTSLEQVGRYYWSLNAQRPRSTHTVQLVVEDVHHYGDLHRLLDILGGSSVQTQRPHLSRMSKSQVEFEFNTDKSLFQVRHLLADQQGLSLLEKHLGHPSLPRIYARLLPAKAAEL